MMSASTAATPVQAAPIAAKATGDAGVIAFNSVSYGYEPPNMVINNVTLSVEQRRVLTLLGPSGCGKSTVLRLIAGLAEPWNGECRFLGRPINGVNTKIGFMTQEDTLLPWLTVSANIALPLKLRKVDAATRQAKTKRYLDMLNLAAAANKFPSQLSGGMKRRALMARSMIYDPVALLMDEPFGALDANLREDLHVELLKTVHELNQTVVFVTHDIAEAAALSDEVLVFSRGPISTIIDRIQIPFGQNRDLKELRRSREFLDIQHTLRASLERGH